MDIRYDDFVELLEHLAHAPEKDLPPMTVASVIKKARGTGNPRLHYARGHVTVTFQTQYGPLQIGEAWVAYPGPDNNTTDWEVFMAVELHEQTWSFGDTRIVDEHCVPSPIEAGELCIELMDAISWVGWEPYVEATLPAREASWNAVKDKYPDIRVDPWGAGWGKSGKKGPGAPKRKGSIRQKIRDSAPRWQIMRSSNLQTIDEPVSCPSCGNRAHFFIKRHYQGSGEYYVDLDGGTADNTDMYSNLKVRDGKILYCADCDEPVARWRPGDLGRVLSGSVGEEGRGDG